MNRDVQAFLAWAQENSAISMVLMIGSQARLETGADRGSDWDFQVVTSETGVFEDKAWMRQAGMSKPCAYSIRKGRLGHAMKVTIVSVHGELDLVLIPALQFRVLQWFSKSGLASYFPSMRRAVSDFAMILRAGYRAMKDEWRWAPSFDRILAKVASVRLDDSAVCSIAEGFFCDYISTCRKISRGEYAAAQRWLHMYLAEPSYQLLHELCLRRGQPSYPDARRIEMFSDRQWPDAITLQALPTQESLFESVELCTSVFRDLVFALAGSKWRWPELEPL